ncbi:hypothetical protein E1293_25930 [Actinomadura darangshiensis]|uniref:SDR family oxidoreductase n=2 Tax=Actinomadura darangshiensis TaxID=705336 RepID=A0A4R5AYJ0_9ACTN|nr:hypothetical protein E1293_25930 [Actinomadura darangshiensis]
MGSLRASAAPRIVNVSSTTASLGLATGGTDFGGDADRWMAYPSSKTALNTDLTGHRGTRTREEGARIIVDLATLSDAGPTGGFVNDQGRVPW